MNSEIKRKVQTMFDLLYYHHRFVLEKPNGLAHPFHLLGARHVPTDLLINEGASFTYGENTK